MSEVDIENVSHDFAFLKPGCIKKMQRTKPTSKEGTDTLSLFYFWSKILQGAMTIAFRLKKCIAFPHLMLF